jgi:subtilisin family serine protease
MDKAQGDALKAAVLKGAKVTLTVVVEKTDHASMQGTSMATPHVSGVVALVRAANPELSPVQVRDLISSTAVKLSGPNNENQWGAGLINAEAAVSRASIMPAVAGL